ncbi:MAG: hypothetical protein RLZZ602_1603 [Pseudomonadota bacterium]|jgi:hypothetical protein
MAKYSSGKRALGQCDRCGFVYKLNTLERQVVNKVYSGLRVCKSCLDVDHPQLQLGKYPVEDPQALRDPRPDTATLGASRAIFVTLDPVYFMGRVGQLEVTV